MWRATLLYILLPAAILLLWDYYLFFGFDYWLLPRPQIGECWQMKPARGDPFPQHLPRARILDIRHGWIQYDLGRASISTRSMQSFMASYAHVADAVCAD